MSEVDKLKQENRKLKSELSKLSKQFLKMIKEDIERADSDIVLDRLSERKDVLEKWVKGYGEPQEPKRK